MDVDELMKTEFFVKLLNDGKPAILSYLKEDGPVITEDNMDYVVETLMIDYLKKNEEILKVFVDYKNKKSEFDVLTQFQNDVNENVGSRIKVMDFHMYNPTYDLKEQLQEVMSKPDFYKWAIN